MTLRWQGNPLGRWCRSTTPADRTSQPVHIQRQLEREACGSSSWHSGAFALPIAGTGALFPDQDCGPSGTPGSALDRPNLHELGAGIAATLQAARRNEDCRRLAGRVHPQAGHALHATG